MRRAISAALSSFHDATRAGDNEEGRFVALSSVFVAAELHALYIRTFARTLIRGPLR